MVNLSLCFIATIQPAKELCSPFTPCMFDGEGENKKKWKRGNMDIDYSFSHTRYYNERDGKRRVHFTPGRFSFSGGNIISLNFHKNKNENMVEGGKSRPFFPECTFSRYTFPDSPSCYGVG